MPLSDFDFGDGTARYVATVDLQFGRKIVLSNPCFFA